MFEDARPPYEPLVPPGGSDCHVRDMTATFSADLSLQRVQETLREHDQWLPVDGDPQASVGRLIEHNSSGPLRLGYGAWRDLLLGCQFHNGRGELITAGGKTVKNVAGYDLTKFMVGQRGLFGKLITITTRVYRRPAGVIVARVDPRPNLVGELMPGSLRPQYALLTAEYLLLGYMSDEPTLAFHRQQLEAMQPRPLLEQATLEEDITRRARLWNVNPAGQDAVGFRASVPPARLSRFVEALNSPEWAADAAFGIVVGTATPQQVEPLRQAAIKANGSCWFWNSEGDLLNLPLDQTCRAVLRRLKDAFDPDGRLAPLPLSSE